jgi:hypothetical protein
MYLWNGCADVKLDQLKWKETSQECSFQIWRPSEPPKDRRPLLPRATPPSSDTFLASQHVHTCRQHVQGCAPKHGTVLQASGQEVRYYITPVRRPRSILFGFLMSDSSLQDRNPCDENPFTRQCRATIEELQEHVLFLMSL